MGLAYRLRGSGGGAVPGAMWRREVRRTVPGMCRQTGQVGGTRGVARVRRRWRRGTLRCGVRDGCVGAGAGAGNGLGSCQDTYDNTLVALVRRRRARRTAPPPVAARRDDTGLCPPAGPSGRHVPRPERLYPPRMRSTDCRQAWRAVPAVNREVPRRSPPRPGAPRSDGSLPCIMRPAIAVRRAAVAKSTGSLGSPKPGRSRFGYSE